MAEGPNRILGDTVGRTIVKLAIISLVVGFVMNMMGWRPWDLIRLVERAIYDLWHSGFAALGKFGDYLLVGAMVVIPVFIILRIVNWRKS